MRPPFTSRSVARRASRFVGFGVAVALFLLPSKKIFAASPAAATSRAVARVRAPVGLLHAELTPSAGHEVFFDVKIIPNGYEIEEGDRERGRGASENERLGDSPGAQDERPGDRFLLGRVAPRGGELGRESCHGVFEVRFLKRLHRGPG